jgi:hypothetical protein
MYEEAGKSETMVPTELTRASRAGKRGGLQSAINPACGRPRSRCVHARLQIRLNGRAICAFAWANPLGKSRISATLEWNDSLWDVPGAGRSRGRIHHTRSA